MVLCLELFDILRAFASLVPPNKIIFPKDLSSTTLHDFFLERVLLNPHFLQYSPSEQYQKSFWKWAIQHLENMAPVEDFEVDPRIYEHYLTLLPSSGLAPGSAKPNHPAEGLPVQRPPAPSYVTHFWRPVEQENSQGGNPPDGLIQLDEYETITLLESRTTVESGTTGLRTWLASFVLSQYLTNHAQLVKDKRILELGSGIGFLGIVIARLQQLTSSDASRSSLWLTDVNENVLTRCRDNIQMPCNRSSSGPNIRYRFLDWTDAENAIRVAPLTSLLQTEVDADLIVGADIIFDPSLIPALTGVLRLALQPGQSGSPKTALISATIRNQETFDQFIDSAQRQVLRVQELLVQYHETTFMQDIDNNTVKILQITLG